MHPSLAHRVPAYWLAVLGLLTILSTPASSQSTSGRILGRVADPTGAVLSGVKITLTNEATGASRDVPDATPAATTILWKLCRAAIESNLSSPV